MLTDRFKFRANQTIQNARKKEAERLLMEKENWIRQVSAQLEILGENLDIPVREITITRDRGGIEDGGEGLTEERKSAGNF